MSLLIFFMIYQNPINTCPSQIAYYKILISANSNYEKQNFLLAIEDYKKIESCEQFYNIEKNLFQYAMSIIHFCKENDSFLIEECKENYHKAKLLLKTSINMLKPSSSFKKELSLRYYYLGFIFIKLNQCHQAKQYFMKSYQIYYNNEAYKNYHSLQLVCKN